MIKHATAGGYVFCRYAGEWRLGLVEHPRMKVMACPGGHVEDDETPAQAALREIVEETGLSSVRLLSFPTPVLPAGFPATHAPVPLPWWIIEADVPADTHLAVPHVHVDYVWIALAPDMQPEGKAEHPFAWYTAEAVQNAGLAMFEDSRVLAGLLFRCLDGMPASAVTGHSILAQLPAVGLTVVGREFPASCRHQQILQCGLGCPGGGDRDFVASFVAADDRRDSPGHHDQFLGSAGPQAA